MKKSKTRGDFFEIVLFVSFLLIFSCGGDTTSGERAERASGARGDILIGIVDNTENSDHFHEGVDLAIKEINREGGVLGRKLQTLYQTDRNDFEEGRRIAKDLAGNPDVIAVIGHLDPDVAIAASVIYEQAGLLFISYGVAVPALMQYGGKLSFTDVPDVEEAARRLIKLAKDAGKRKVVVFYERNPGHKRSVSIFHKQATMSEMEIVATRSFFSYEHDFRALEWEYDFNEIIWMLKEDYEFDAILIVGDVRPAAVLIRQLRGLDVDARIFGGGGLDSIQLPKGAGDAAEGVIVATVFNPQDPVGLTRLFIDRFVSEYGAIPDQWAAQGYDSIRMLASAIRKSETAEPAKVAESLRFFENWEGVSGMHTFTPDGHIVDRTIYFKQIVDGKFVYIDPL